MMRPEIASPGCDFRDERELFKRMGKMVPGGTAGCGNNGLATPVSRQPQITSKKPRTLVRVLPGIKITSRAVLSPDTHFGHGIARKAWPAA